MNTVRVHRWISKKEKISYTFGHESDNPDIPIIILQDDSLNKAITKITLGIVEYHSARKEPVPQIDAIPYIWTNKESLRFEFSQKDIKIPINPWDITTAEAEKLKTHALTAQNVQILYNQDALFMKNTINIVFKNDISPSVHSYYFPDYKIIWKPNFTIKELIKESHTLYTLWNTIKNDPEEQRPFIFSKIRFIGNVKESALPISPLSVLFESIHTTSRVPFIQYIEDSSKVLYKVWKKHNIAPQLLQNWTFYDRLPKVEMIIAMIPLEREHTFARATLDKNGNISIQYQIDSRDKVAWDVIETYTARIKQWFENILLTPISLHVDSISGKGEFASQGISVQDVSKNIGKSIFIPLYHVIRVQEGVIHVAFKRSKNYHSQLDISDYISSNIKLGIPLQEIAQDLIDLGMTQKEVLLWIEQYQTQTQTEADIPKKKSLSFTGCVFKIDKSPYGFRIIMENVATLEELKFIYHWVRSTFKYIMQETLSKKAPPPSPPPTPSIPVPPPSPPKEQPKEKPKEQPKQTISSSSSEEDIFGKELELSGGAGKKGHGTDRYFLSQLQQNDPAIFLDTKNYARLCAANNFRQPIVVSQQEKEKIDSEGYKEAYDDSIHYGSDKQHMNHYMCPRIWCPTSRIPMTEKQLEDNNGRCPGPHFEKPMKLYENKYWDNDAKIKHHIGFHKQKTPTGLCLPCCMKNPLKEREINDCKTPSETVPEKDKGKSKHSKPGQATKESERDLEQSMKEDGYIMGATAPLPVDRYGALPKDLHTFLQPKVPYQLCSKTISSTECYLRKGIQHFDDSLLNAISISLAMKSKKDLVKHIIKHLDPLTFITLANGHILYAFMDKEPIIINSTNVKDSTNFKLIKQWSEWMKSNIAYSRQIGLTIANISTLSEIDPIILSRELAIFKAYLNFIEYLQSNDTKNPEHLQEVLLSMNIILLIWKRQDNVATLQCLTYSNVDDIFNAAQNNKKIAMILEENSYYEPIELKQRGKIPIPLFEENGTLSKEVKSVLNQCPTPYKTDTMTYTRERAVIENIRALISWSQLRLFSPTSFMIQSVIIRQDFTIYGFLTRGNLLIRGPQEGLAIHILRELFDIIPSMKRIIYLEDITNHTLNIHEVFKNDFILFHNKLQDLGFVLHSGNILLDEESLANREDVLNGQLIIESLNGTILPFIRTRINDAIYKNTFEIKANDKKWHELQHAVGNTLLKSYETLVEPLFNGKLNRKERIRILLNTFRKIPDKDKIQTILEEIPLEYGKDALVRWIRSIGLEKRSRIYTSAFVQNDKVKKEWVFSQAAVEHGLPIDVIKPVVSIHPNEKFANNRVVEYQKDQSRTSEDNSIALPLMLQKTANEMQTLPSKWVQMKNYSWNQYNWYRMTDAVSYTRESIPQLFEWIANNIHTTLIWTDVLSIRNKMIIGFIQNKETDIMLKLLEDPSFFKAWAQLFKRKYKDGADIWKNKLATLNTNEKIAAWKEVLTKHSAIIWPMDLDLKIVSMLMNISILVIYRGKYGEGVGTGKRGNVEDLFISSTFYHGDEKDWQKRPCIIFYRSIDKEKVTFSPIIHTESDTFIHPSVSSMPKDIQQLLEYHFEKENSTSVSSSSYSSS
jgi:hypothetical protein